MQMVSKRRRRVLAGVLGASVLTAFVACSGSSDRRVVRDNGAAGDGSEAGGGGSVDGSEQGGSANRGGSQGGELPNAGSPGEARGGDDGAGGTDAAGGQPAGAGGESLGGQAAGGESLGGQAAGGESLGGQAAGGAGGAGGAGAGGQGGDSGLADAVCGAAMVQVGAYSLWCGKVNMHTDAQGQWVHDSDCTSGCNIDGVGYCQKFYPDATSVVAVPQLETKDWKNAGCADSAPDGAGISGEAACCAPVVE